MLYSSMYIGLHVVCRKVLEKKGPFTEVPLISEQIEYLLLASTLLARFVGSAADR
jgi:hypothetical protein